MIAMPAGTISAPAAPCKTRPITRTAKRGLVGCEDEESVTSLVVIVISYQLSGGEGLRWCNVNRESTSESGANETVRVLPLELPCRIAEGSPARAGSRQ